MLYMALARIGRLWKHLWGESVHLSGLRGHYNDKGNITGIRHSPIKCHTTT